MNIDRLRSEFKNRYGRESRIFRAPGRVNLIGEHTDYNEGFVLPCAIDFATYVAASTRSDRKVRVASVNFPGEFEFDLDQPTAAKAEMWAKYVQGVAIILERRGFRLGGADLLIDSDVPVGAGLSSSAALEISTAFALASLSGHKIDGMDLARIGQAAEHEFALVRSGIMDQFASVFGEAGNALFLDCRSLNWEPVPVGDAQFVICNTKTKHELADGEYNKRRAECEAAAEFFGVEFLRDVTLEGFNLRSGEMDEIPMKRARHIITENERVLSAVNAFRSDDLESLGKLFNKSHSSMRDDFEISCREVDLMVDLARKQPGVLGARMTGGGFGGCTINLLSSDTYQEFADAILNEYERETGIIPEIYACDISGGVSQVTAS